MAIDRKVLDKTRDKVVKYLGKDYTSLSPETVGDELDAILGFYEEVKLENTREEIKEGR
jgi:hypothetical protein